MRQPGEGPGSDCEIFGNLRITFVASSTEYAAVSLPSPVKRQGDSDSDCPGSVANGQDGAPGTQLMWRVDTSLWVPNYYIAMCPKYN